jgi:hypothetical protein
MQKDFSISNSLLALLLPVRPVASPACLLCKGTIITSPAELLGLLMQLSSAGLWIGRRVCCCTCCVCCCMLASLHLLLMMMLHVPAAGLCSWEMLLHACR